MIRDRQPRRSARRRVSLARASRRDSCAPGSSSPKAGSSSAGCCAIPRFRTRSVLLTDAACDVAARRRSTARHPTVDVFVVDQPVMNAIAGFNIHRGCLALAERPAPLALDGSAARRRDARPRPGRRQQSGQRRRHLPQRGGVRRRRGRARPGCGDPLYRKAIRTSMAATLAVPFADGRPVAGRRRTLSARTACACWRSRPRRTRARSTTCRAISHASRFSSARKATDCRRRRWRPQTTACGFR